MPSLAGATAWLNSPPLTPEGLRGKVVLVDFWTYTCINWLRTLPYVRAWAAKYKDQGLVVIGVHSPEFELEKDLENVRRAVKDMGIVYPVAVDSDHAVWRAFDNEYWPALYLVDAKGHIRYHQFGEGEYERTERVIQQLLTEAGATGVDRELVKVEARGSGGGRRLDQPQVRRELCRLRAHRELRVPRRHGSGQGSRLLQPAPTEAQRVGAVRQLDAGTPGRRAERRQRTDHLPLPRPRSPSRDGAGGAGKSGAVSGPHRRTSAGPGARDRRGRAGKRHRSRISACTS